MNNNKRSYLIRFARERIDTPWRIIVKSAANNDTHYFADMDALNRFFIRAFPELGTNADDSKTTPDS